MKKIIVISLLSVFSLLFIVACFDAKDFDMDKLSVSDVSPNLYVPLFKDSLYLKPGDDFPVMSLEDGTMAFYFATGNINIPAIKAPVIKPVHVNLPSGTLTESGFIGGDLSLFDITPPVLTTPVTIEMPNNERIDSVIVDRLQMTINSACTFPATFTVSIPGFTERGPSTLTTTGGPDLPISLTGKLALSNNKFDIKVTVQLPSYLEGGAHSYGGTLDFDISEESVLKVIYGYFGRVTYTAEKTPVTINAFNKLMGNCNVAAAYLKVSANNPIGIPVQLKLSEINVGATTEFDVDSLTVLAAKRIGSSTPTNEQIGGAKLGNIINAVISSGDGTNAGFTFSVISNPDGKTTPDGKPVSNFFTSSNNVIEASGTVVVPLKLSVSNLTLSETLEINGFDDYTFEELGAKVHVVNSMPVSVGLQGVLLDTDRNVMYKTNPEIRDTVFLFSKELNIAAAEVGDNGMVVKPTESKLDLVSLEEAAIRKLTDASLGFIQMRLMVQTSQGKEVVITEKNYVKLQVGVKAKVNLDDIDK